MLLQLHMTLTSHQTSRPAGCMLHLDAVFAAETVALHYLFHVVFSVIK